MDPLIRILWCNKDSLITIVGMPQYESIHCSFQTMMHAPWLSVGQGGFIQRQCLDQIYRNGRARSTRHTCYRVNGTEEGPVREFPHLWALRQELEA